MLSNNLANVNTAGFKADREVFSQYLSADAKDPFHPELVVPTITRNFTDFQQGALQRTDNPLNFALQGEGFFTVRKESAAGAAPEPTLVTRAGNFGVDARGTLRTQDGYTVLDTLGRPITLLPGQDFTINSAGQIFQQGNPIAQLGIVELADRGQLQKFGHTYYSVSPLPDGTSPLQPASRTTVTQGYLETSNTSPGEATVRMINVLRQFESLQKALNLGTEMNRRALEDVAKVPG